MVITEPTGPRIIDWSGPSTPEREAMKRAYEAKLLVHQEPLGSPFATPKGETAVFVTAETARLVRSHRAARRAKQKAARAARRRNR